MALPSMPAYNGNCNMNTKNSNNERATLAVSTGSLAIAISTLTMEIATLAMEITTMEIAVATLEIATKEMTTLAITI